MLSAHFRLKKINKEKMEIVFFFFKSMKIEEKKEYEHTFTINNY